MDRRCRGEMHSYTQSHRLSSAMLCAVLCSTMQSMPTFISDEQERRASNSTILFSRDLQYGIAARYSIALHQRHGQTNIDAREYVWSQYPNGRRTRIKHPAKLQVSTPLFYRQRRGAQGHRESIAQMDRTRVGAVYTCARWIPR